MRFIIDVINVLKKVFKKNHQICIICYQANLLYKPSGNKIIDEFIKDIKMIGKGGFSKIYKATWINGPSYWNEAKEDFEYKDSIIVALKQLNDSKDITSKELNEVQYIDLI